MPQGKLKAKAKLPKSVQAKKKGKGPGVSKRRNAPVTPKKAKQVQAQKLKKAITKAGSIATEEELRAIALDGKKSLLSKKTTSPRGGAKAKKTKKK